jgi:hypothetical protein
MVNHGLQTGEKALKAGGMVWIRLEGLQAEGMAWRSQAWLEQCLNLGSPDTGRQTILCHGTMLYIAGHLVASWSLPSRCK